MCPQRIRQCSAHAGHCAWQSAAALCRCLRETHWRIRSADTVRDPLQISLDYRHYGQSAICVDSFGLYIIIPAQWWHSAECSTLGRPLPSNMTQDEGNVHFRFMNSWDAFHATCQLHSRCNVFLWFVSKSPRFWHCIWNQNWCHTMLSGVHWGTKNVHNSNWDRGSFHLQLKLLDSNASLIDVSILVRNQDGGDSCKQSHAFEICVQLHFQNEWMQFENQNNCCVVLV